MANVGTDLLTDAGRQLASTLETLLRWSRGQRAQAAVLTVPPRQDAEPLPPSVTYFDPRR